MFQAASIPFFAYYCLHSAGSSFETTSAPTSLFRSDQQIRLSYFLHNRFYESSPRNPTPVWDDWKKKRALAWIHSVKPWNPLDLLPLFAPKIPRIYGSSEPLLVFHVAARQKSASNFQAFGKKNGAPRFFLEGAPFVTFRWSVVCWDFFFFWGANRGIFMGWRQCVFLK